MIPACPHPLMLAGGGDPLDELAKIERSLRLRRAASAILTRTPGANGNRTTQVLRVCVKRAEIGQEFYLYSAGDNTASPTLTLVRFASGNALEVIHTINNVVQWRLVSTALYRDPAAHLDVIVGVDTTQATAANRVLVGLNGQQITSFSTASYPTQNSLTCWSDTAYQHVIGRNSGITFAYSDGYYAHHVVIDGYPSGITSGTWAWAALAALFGVAHPRTGQWRPKGRAAIKALADAGGINSHFLPFDDPTNTTTLCADASSKGNNFTATNVSLTAGATYDSMLDTPTANYCTLNSLIGYSTAPAFSDGNLTFLGTVAGAQTVFGTMGMSAGVWWWEFKPSSNNTPVGIAKANATPNNYLGSDANGWAYNESGQKFNNGSASAYGATFSSSDTIGVKFDADAGTLEFFKQTNSTGAFVSQGLAYTGLTNGPYFPAGSDGATGTSEGGTFNFGQRPLNNSSLPTGAKTLNTKNLPINPRGPMKSTDAFVGALDTGANIQATLAAKRASWTSYIEIFRSRGAEGWRIRFSDDLANYLDTSTTNAKAAFPALGGASYVAYALKVSAANGVATGTFAHVNGVADTITDNLGNTRKAIMLKCESAGGGNFFFYHPELTAGKLLYLNSAAIETTDASIGSVTANSFVAAAALPTGTYRWIGLAELADFLRLFKWAGTGSTDGACLPTGHSAAFLHSKRIDAVGNHYIQDTTRSPSNATNAMLALEQATAESTGSAIDFNAGNVKLRNTDSSQNASGGSYVGISIAAFPFRYANAR